MQICVFSAKPYDIDFLTAANGDGRHQITFFQEHLSLKTSLLATGAQAVCVFVNDEVSADVIAKLSRMGIRLVLLRCAGFNNVDLEAAQRSGVVIGRVPAYSPHAVAEHTIGLILSLNRQIPRAVNRVRDGNFALDGLLGFDLAGKTVGIVGLGKIGLIVARILASFGCRVLAHDPLPQAGHGFPIENVSLNALLTTSDIVSLHCPLTPDTLHMIDERSIGRMKRGVMLVNTSRGALVDTRAVIAALKEGNIGSLALDVYEEEADLFFEDLSRRIISDDVFARLLTFPNVIITGHQGFFTREALTNIARTTLDNANAFAETGRVIHPVTTDLMAGSPALSAPHGPAA